MIFWIVVLTPLSLAAFATGVILLHAVLREGRQATEHATGVVLGHEASEDEEGVYYTPVVRFTVDGQEFLARGRLAPAGRPPYRVGQPLTVYYPPGRPDQALLQRYEGWWIAAALLLFGAGFLLTLLAEVFRLFR
jgi:hypothetical protein